jgi:hypothetical protein
MFDASREDFKDSAHLMLDRPDFFVFRRGPGESDGARPPWLQLPAHLLRKAVIVTAARRTASRPALSDGKAHPGNSTDVTV